MSKADEEHAKSTLSGELGVELLIHDDGSKPGMPDLLSVDGKHVAEVITTAPSSVREAQQNLYPTSSPTLPHCVWVVIPYTAVGGATKRARENIAKDVLRWIAESGCNYHWQSRDPEHVGFSADSPPILALGAYDDGVTAVCVQRCKHPDEEPHQIRWSVAHEPSAEDPWNLIRRSLEIVGREQHGDVQALAEKLIGYPNKHLVLYPFGSPGNLMAALGSYVPPSNPRDLMPPTLKPPLDDVHIWLLYLYGHRGVVEGLHVCSGHWAKFGTAFPKPDLTSPLERLHYRET